MMKKINLVVVSLLGLCLGAAPFAHAQGNKNLPKTIVRKVVQEQAEAKQLQTVLADKVRAAREELAIKENMRLQSKTQAANSYHSLTHSGTIVPTPKDQLKFNAYRLTPSQIQENADKYEQLMKDFLEFKQNLDARVFYLELYKDAIGPMEKKQLLREGGELASHAKYQLDFLLKDDIPLQRAYIYLVDALERLEPAYFGMLEKKGALAARKDRAFVPEQFFLKDPAQTQWREIQWEDYQPMSSGAKELVLPVAQQLPKNLRIALVNDLPAMVGSFKSWAAAGYFGEGTQVEVFSSAIDFLNTKQEFDVIVTDLLIPGGGGQYLAYQLRKNGYQKPIIALSEYREEDCRALELFNLGIDGYIYADDFFRNYIGYRYFPAALKTYFDLKNQHGWQH